MNRTAWIVQFDAFQPIIGSDPVAPYLVGQGFNRVAVKALDGAAWEGQFDHSSDGIHSVADLKSWQDSFNRHGLAMDVWVNVTKGDLHAALPLYQQILDSVNGRLIYDLEPYKGFWGDFSALDPALGSLRGQDRVAVSFDPRQMDWIRPALGWGKWLMPQVYEAAWIRDLYQDEAAGTWEPLVYSQGSGQDWLTICRDSVIGNTRGRSGFGVFSCPLVGLERLAVLRGLA